MATMRVLQTDSKETGSDLGPTLSVEVDFEGSPVNALLDTGSPVSIVFLQFLLQALARQKPNEQDPTEWAAAVRSRLDPPTMTL